MLLSTRALPCCARSTTCFTQQRLLHVFVRGPVNNSRLTPPPNFTKVHFGFDADGGDLKDAVMLKLRLNAPPSSVCLSVEEGGTLRLLDSRQQLTQQGVRKGSSVVVEVEPAPAAVQWVEWLGLGRLLRRFAPVTLTLHLRPSPGQPARALQQPFASAAEFQRFLQGRSLYSVQGEGSSSVRSCMVLSLDAAFAACSAGARLELDEPSSTLLEDVSNLKGFRSNTARGIEELCNKGAAVNSELLKAHGGKLQALNGGRSVSFAFRSGGAPYLECDGLIANTSIVLLNEVKTHFTVQDVQHLTADTGVRLQHVLEHPSLFCSQPEGALQQLAGLRIVPLASSCSFSREAGEACAAAKVHQLKRDGSGFKCTLAV